MIEQQLNLPQHLCASAVERVELDRSGQRVLTLCDGESSSWWRDSKAGWTPITPADDGELPFSAALCAQLAEPGSRVLAWKPGRRLTALVRRPTGPVVVKAYRGSAFGRARDAHLAAERALLGSELGFARLLRRNDAQGWLEFDFVEGSPLRIDESSLAQHFRLGAGLRQLQDAQALPGLAAHTALEEQRVIESMHQRAAAIGAELPVDFGATLLRWSVQARRLPLALGVLCHRDLHDGQLLQARQRVTCLDFDLLCLADAALDPANYVAHLHLRALQGLSGATPQAALSCARAFLEGLDRTEDPSFHARLRLYQAAAFLRLSAVYAMRPRWLLLVPQLANLARRCLEELERE